MSQSSELKDIICSNKECRRVLAQITADKIISVDIRVSSDKLSDKKKKFSPLYCIHCGRTTRFYKKKFQSNTKQKFITSPKLLKRQKK